MQLFSQAPLIYQDLAEREGNPCVDVAQLPLFSDPASAGPDPVAYEDLDQDNSPMDGEDICLFHQFRHFLGKE
jgi:hypothetical protein